MKALRRLLARIRGTFDVNGGDEALTREMQAHLDFATEEFIRRGMTQSDARRAAVLEARGIQQAQEAWRDQRGIRILNDLMRTLRSASRSLKRNPTYAVGIILSLALGIGLNAAIFTVIDAVVRRPLPYPNADEIKTFGMYTKRPDEPTGATNWTLYGVLDQWRQARSIGVVASFAPFRDHVVQGEGNAENLSGAGASANLLQLLGTSPLLGRWFRDDESRSRVVVLSEGLWRRQFNGDRGVVGKILQIDGRPQTVIGVLPRGIGLPLDAQFWFPSGGEAGAQVIARPSPGLPERTIISELESISPSVANLRKRGHAASVIVMPLHEQLFGSARPTLAALLGASALFFLIACANVTNLVLARTVERQRELAVRAVLGASARSLAALVTIENAVLALAGGAVAIVIAVVMTSSLTVFAPASLSLSRQVTVALPTLLLVVSLVVISCIAVSLIPVRKILRGDSLTLSQAGSRSGRAPGLRNTRRVLVATQLSLALVLLTTAGLLIRSVSSMTRVDQLGFAPGGVVILNLRTFGEIYRDNTAVGSLTQRIVTRLREIPEVEEVTVGPPPIVGGSADRFREGFDLIFTHGDLSRPNEPSQTVWAKFVDEHYLGTFGIHLRAGRGFTSGDNAQAAKVAILSERAARVLFGDTNPIGKFLPGTALTQMKPGVIQVVGVVNDIGSLDPSVEVMPEVMLPVAQNDRSSMVRIALRSSLPASNMVPVLHRILAEEAPTLAPSRLQPLEDLVDAALARHRFVLRLLMLFASLGIVLAAVGLYAVISYLVTQRITEIAVRIALGARYRQVIRLVVGEGAVITALALLTGIPLTFAAGRSLGTLVYALGSFDIATLSIAVGVLATIALVASYIPARRAAALDPAATLRSD